MSKEIEKQYKKLGVKILTATKVESINDHGRGYVTVSKDGKSDELKATRCCRPSVSVPTSKGSGSRPPA